MQTLRHYFVDFFCKGYALYRSASQDSLKISNVCFFFRRIYGVSHIFTDAYIRFQIHVLYTLLLMCKNLRASKTHAVSFNASLIRDEFPKDARKIQKKITKTYKLSFQAHCVPLFFGRKYSSCCQSGSVQCAGILTSIFQIFRGSGRRVPLSLLNQYRCLLIGRDLQEIINKNAQHRVYTLKSIHFQIVGNET